MSGQTPTKCTCGANFKDQNTLLAHVEAMKLYAKNENPTGQRTGDDGFDNRKHDIGE